MLEKYCILVDPYISAPSIIRPIRECGYKIIAVLTDMPIESSEFERRFPEELFDMVIKYKGTQTISQLGQYPIARVIAGFETTVNVADLLAKALTPQYANPPETSDWRNNKFAMQERLLAVNVAAVQQIMLHRPELTKKEETKIAKMPFPLFMKPTKANSSFGANRCNDMADVKRSLKSLIGSKPSFGIVIDSVTLQQCLFGDEYFVDSVSLSGKPRIVSVFKYNKIYYEEHPIYRYAEIVDPHSPEAITCIDYTKSVLDALQLRNGFAHTELFLTKEGPYLIELNPRISGVYGFMNLLALHAGGIDQPNMMAESISEPEKFLSEYKKLPDFKLHGRVVTLQSWQEKKLGKFNYQLVESLKSYNSVKILYPEGAPVHPPKYLADTVGILLLQNEDKKALVQDYDQVIEWEKRGELF